MAVTRKIIQPDSLAQTPGEILDRLDAISAEYNAIKVEHAEVKVLNEKLAQQVEKLIKDGTEKAEENKTLVAKVAKMTEEMGKMKDKLEGKSTPTAAAQKAKTETTRVDLWNVKDRLKDSGQDPETQARIIKALS